MKLISIVMGYYNRKPQLEITLNTIQKQYNPNNMNLEVIIVDDASDPEHQLKDLISNYSFKIKLIMIDKSDKKWTNPVIPYNIGIKNSLGEIIVFQNPEVCHLGPVINDIYERINDDIYLIYSVYSSKSFIENDIIKSDIETNKNLIDIYSQKPYKFEYDWYSHPVYQNRRYHFLSAMTRETLNKIGGFDPKFYDGHSFDDDDFRNRIEKVVKSKTIEPKKCLGIHLYHKNVHQNHPNFWTIWNLNKDRMNKNLIDNIIFCDINQFLPNYILKTNF